MWHHVVGQVISDVSGSRCLHLPGISSLFSSMQSWSLPSILIIRSFMLVPCTTDYPRSDVHRFVFACWWYFFLSNSLPRNIEVGSIPEFETPAVPPLFVSGIDVIPAVSSDKLVWQDSDPWFQAWIKVLLSTYPATVTLRPLKGGRIGRHTDHRRETIILFLTVRLQRPCRMRNYLVPLIALHR